MKVDYLFPDAANSELHQEYAMLAGGLPGVLICSRLGEYRYNDMDHAIQRARELAQGVLSGADTSGGERRS